jgi:hypothetical protein
MTPSLVRAVVVGGMPGWQIAFIAVAAAVVAAVTAVAPGPRPHGPSPPGRTHRITRADIKAPGRASHRWSRGRAAPFAPPSQAATSTRHQPRQLRVPATAQSRLSAPQRQKWLFRVASSA